MTEPTGRPTGRVLPAAPSPTGASPTGLVLAAGAGRRYGGPKALARTGDGTPWLHLAVAALRAGGCERVVVTLGAGASDALPLLPPGVEHVVVAGWNEGVAASLRHGLTAAGRHGADAVVVVTVDTPTMPASAVRRIVSAAGPRPADALVQAVYDNRPGHPVLIGRDHVPAITATVTRNIGARPYLVANEALEVECVDLWDGVDIDGPAPATARPRRSWRRGRVVAMTSEQLARARTEELEAEDARERTALDDVLDALEEPVQPSRS